MATHACSSHTTSAQLFSVFGDSKSSDYVTYGTQQQWDVSKFALLDVLAHMGERVFSLDAALLS